MSEMRSDLRQPNTRLAEAATAWLASPSPTTQAHLLRALMQGEVLLDVSRAGAPEAAPAVEFGTLTGPDGLKALLAHTSLSSGREHRGREAFRGTPVATVDAVRIARERGLGLMVDFATTTCFITPDQLDQQFGPAHNAELKQVLCDVHDGLVGAERLRPQLMLDAPLLLGARPSRGDGQAEAVDTGWALSADDRGRPVLLAFTSLMEAAAHEAGMGASPTTVKDALRAALDAGMAAVVIDPAGPAAVIDRDEMEVVLRR